jgi:hypothetical protein
VDRKTTEEKKRSSNKMEGVTDILALSQMLTGYQEQEEEYESSQVRSFDQSQL